VASFPLAAGETPPQTTAARPQSTASRSWGGAVGPTLSWLLTSKVVTNCWWGI
jgi:hypothetical protein